jgi:hypothetical protein
MPEGLLLYACTIADIIQEYKIISFNLYVIIYILFLNQK